MARNVPLSKCSKDRCWLLVARWSEMKELEWTLWVLPKTLLHCFSDVFCALSSIVGGLSRIRDKNIEIVDVFTFPWSLWPKTISICSWVWVRESWMNVVHHYHLNYRRRTLSCWIFIIIASTLCFILFSSVFKEKTLSGLPKLFGKTGFGMWVMVVKHKKPEDSETGERKTSLMTMTRL